MKTKSKLLISLLIFTGGAIVNLFFSTALDSLLSHRLTRLTILPIEYCIESLTSKQHFLLFLCIQGFFLLLAVLFYTTDMHSYKSELDQITPDIETPRAVGQYQHGSARWMQDDEKNCAFKSYVVNPNDKYIKSLIDSGYDDIDFMKRKDESNDTDKESNQNEAGE